MPLDHERLIARIKTHEGQVTLPNGRHVPYYDSKGVLTIGWGRNLRDNGLSNAEAEQLLQRDVADSIEDAKRLIGEDHFEKMTSQLQEVAVEMAFNLGATKFALFRNTLDAFRRNDAQGVAHHMMDSLWAEQVGTRATNLQALVMSDGEHIA